MNTLAQDRLAAPADAASPYRRTTPTLLQTVATRVWDVLERVGERRAARELDTLARRWAPYDPELAAHLRRAAMRDPDERGV